MTYQPKDLSVLAYANGFTSWHYITADAPAGIIAPDYFNGACDLLRVGDMLAINAGGVEAPVNFMMGVTKASGGVVAISSLWSPASSPESAMSGTADDRKDDALTKAAKRVAWAMRCRLSISYSHHDNPESLWEDLITPDRDAVIEAARAAKAEA